MREPARASGAMAAAVLALSLAALVRAQEGADAASAPAPARARGAAFEVLCHGGDDALAAQALAAVEPVWPVVREFFGVENALPAAPLEVHLYRTVDGYLAADRERTGGRFQPNLAMFHWNTRSAHVALQPPCSDAALIELGLPMQTQAMLAWEACHVARSELCPNFRAHPGWFLDGLAATTAARVLQQRYPGLGPQPFFTQRLLRVQRLLGDGALPEVRALFADATDGLDMRDRYAARVVLFAFLADGERQGALRELARTVRSLGGGGSVAEQVRAAAATAFGGLDAAFADHVRTQSPVWDERGRSLWCIGDTWQQLAWPGDRAEAFCTAPVAGGAFVARGRVRVLQGGSRQMNFLFGRTEEGCYSLALVAGSGFTLFDHRFDGNQWLRVAGGRVPAFAVGEPLPFVVRGRGAALEIELAGQHWDVDLPRALPDAIVWGVGAQGGTQGATTGAVGIWQGLTVGGS